MLNETAWRKPRRFRIDAGAGAAKAGIARDFAP
jgi:hypothetical protein